MSDHNLEFNKLAGGFLVAGLIAMVAMGISHLLYSPKEPEKRGFAIEVPEGGVQVAATEEVVIDINEFMATADIERGAKEAKRRCAACHSFDAGGAHKTGPNLHNIMGQKHAAKAGYPYSSALKEVPGIYDYESMNAWLENPQKVAKGSKMILKLKKPQMRADIIKYLESLK